MKRILFLLAFLVVTVAATAQERTITLNNGNALDLTTTKWVAYNWSGTLDNLVPTTRDTIDIVVLVKNQTSEPLHFYANLTFSPLTTADTTIAITVQEKKFEVESYTDIIASALTSAITAKTTSQLFTQNELGWILLRDASTQSAGFAYGYISTATTFVMAYQQPNYFVGALANPTSIAPWAWAASSMTFSLCFLAIALIDCMSPISNHHRPIARCLY